MLKEALAIALLGVIALSSHAADTERSYVAAPKAADRPAPPFSEAVLVGETLYVAGHIGIDSATGRVPVNGWDEVKKRLAAAAGLVEDWRLHDLRRTCASGMQRLGVRTEVIERALNHRSGVYRGVAGVYQTDLLESEVRAALQMWSDYLEELSAQKTVGKRRSGRAG